MRPGAYQPGPGLTATLADTLLALSSRGGAPTTISACGWQSWMVVDDLRTITSIRKRTAPGLCSARTFAPEYHLVTGVRRMTTQQAAPLRARWRLRRSPTTSSTRTARRHEGLGLNIVGLSDFHGDLHANDAGAVRFQDQRDYGEATRRASDAGFLVTPWEEPSAYFGGHYNILFPKTVYWTKVRKEGQPFTEQDASFGTRLSHRQRRRCAEDDGRGRGLLVPRASPDQGDDGVSRLIFDKAWTKNDRYLGVAFKPGMGWIFQRRGCASGGASTSPTR